jgi:acetylxylan esterase
LTNPHLDGLTNEVIEGPSQTAKMKLTAAILSLLGLASAATAASLTRVNSFGANTSNAKMFIYVPDKLADKPPIIVAIHYCTGSAQAYFTGSPYKGLADKKGFIVIYPESPYSGTCWDVSSKATLTHEGGANSNSIANMVKYTLDKYKGDETKVFVTGSSSGAMMTVSRGVKLTGF